MLDSFKTDPMLAKADPISSGGSASMITYLRRVEGKEPCWGTAVEEGVRICERNKPADAKINEEIGGERAPGSRVDSSPGAACS